MTHVKKRTQACGVAHVHARGSSKAAARTAHALTCSSTGLRARAVHLDVINQCDWIAGVRLGLELRWKGPFWGWTDPNRLWQGGYWKQVLGLRSAGEAALNSAAPGSNARGRSTPLCILATRCPLCTA